jgi:hypothetical protein
LQGKLHAQHPHGERVERNRVARRHLRGQRRTSRGACQRQRAKNREHLDGCLHKKEWPDDDRPAALRNLRATCIRTATESPLLDYFLRGRAVLTTYARIAMTPNHDSDDLRDEYAFTAEELRAGVRGKYAERYAEGTNLVPLDPDVAEVFPDADSVNRALRALAGIIRESSRPAA